MNMFQRLTPSPFPVQSESASPAPVGSVLSQFRVTKRKLKKLDAIATARGSAASSPTSL
jgi:hypothetical protein